MHESAAHELARDERDAACLEEIGRDVAPTGLDVRDDRRRAETVSKSSIVSSIPASAAIASRCRTPLVDPPVAAIAGIAFSNASRVSTCDGRVSSTHQLHRELARDYGGLRLARVIRGHLVQPGCADAEKVEAVAIVFAVK